MSARFTRFVAIDWSGAKGPLQPGIAVAECEMGLAAPRLLAPPGSAWSRAAVLDRLIEWAAAEAPVLIGLDLSTGFPFADRGAYFPGWAESPPDMCTLWATIDNLAADDPYLGAEAAITRLAPHFRQRGRCGELFEAGRGRLRVTERLAMAVGLSPTSCFNLVGAAQVGKASLTGMRVLHALAGRIPLWPLDALPARGPVLVEIYTTIAARAAGLGAGRSKLRDADALDRALAVLGSAPHRPLTRYDDHATDALIAAAWLRAHAGDAGLWTPKGLTPRLARTEGWTFGVR